jgi:hypothetical protein
VKAVYVSVERDAEKMNHMHLAIASTPDTNLKKRIASAVNIREKSIGNIEPIRGKNETLLRLPPAVKLELLHHLKNSLKDPYNDSKKLDNSTSRWFIFLLVKLYFRSI